MKLKFNKPDPEKLKAIEDFGRRTQAVGAAIMKTGMALLGAGLLSGALLLLVFWIF